MSLVDDEDVDRLSARRVGVFPAVRALLTCDTAAKLPELVDLVFH